MLLVLFLTAGSWKSAAWLTVIQSHVDITMLLALFAGIAALPHIGRAPWTRAGLARLSLFVVPLALLAVALGVRTLPALSPYGIEKAVRFASLTCLAFAAATATARDRKAALRLAGWLAAVSLGRVLLYLACPPTLNEGTAVSGYLGSSRLAGLGLVASFGILLPHVRTIFRRLALLLVTWPLLWWVLLAGARGPLFSALGAAIAFNCRSITSWHPLRLIPRLDRHGMLLIGLLATAMILAPAFSWRVPIPSPWAIDDVLTTPDRMQVLFAEAEGGTSVSARLGFYRSAAIAFAGSPLLGTGTGTFREDGTPPGVRAYPHNLALETASELGLFGLLPLGVLLAVTAVTLARRPASSDPRRSALLVGLFGLFVYALTNAMLSGDINDNRVLFAICGVAAGYSWRHEILRTARRRRRNQGARATQSSSTLGES